LSNEEFPVSRLGNFKPRITELTPGYDGNDIELVEYLDEKREQDSETTDRSAHPVKILSYQSTLSSEKGEAAELMEESQSSKPVSDDAEQEEDIEIPYQVEDGSEVKIGPPSEAIEETDNLDSVVEMLEAKDLLEDYQEEVQASRSGSQESREDDVDESELVEKEIGYVFEPDEELEAEEEEKSSDETKTEDDTGDDDEGEEEQKVLMRDGEVV